MGAVQQALLGLAAAAPSTFDPLNKTSGVTLSGGNLTSTSTGSSQGVRGTLSHSSGKWYAEFTFVSRTAANNNLAFGICNSTASIGGLQGISDANGAAYASGGILTFNSNGGAVAATIFVPGDVIGIAVDVTNHLVYFALNNTWQNSGNPSAGTGGNNYITTSPMYLVSGTNTSVPTFVYTLNVGTTALAYTPPTGYSPWG